MSEWIVEIRDTSLAGWGGMEVGHAGNGLVALDGGGCVALSNSSGVAPAYCEAIVFDASGAAIWDAKIASPSGRGASWMGSRVASKGNYIAFAFGGEAFISDGLGGTTTGNYSSVVVLMNATTKAVIWQAEVPVLCPNSWWSTGLGTSSFTVDATGNVYIAGDPADHSSTGVWGLLKLSAADGSILWQKDLLGVSDTWEEVDVSVRLLSGGDVVVASRDQGTPVVRRLSGSTGAVSWTRRVAADLGSPYVTGTPGNMPSVEIAVDPSDNIYCAGGTYYASNYFPVVKLDASGATLWNRAVAVPTGATGAASGSLYADASGVFVGVYLTAIDYGFPLLGTAHVEAPALYHVSADGSTVQGSAWLHNSLEQANVYGVSGNADGIYLLLHARLQDSLSIPRRLHVVKTSPTDFTERAYTDTALDTVTRTPLTTSVIDGGSIISTPTLTMRSDPSLALLSYGNVTLSTFSATEFLLYSYDPTDYQQWALELSGSGALQGGAVAKAPSGDVYFAARDVVNNAVVLMRLTGSGAIVWQENITPGSGGVAVTMGDFAIVSNATHVAVAAGCSDGSSTSTTLRKYAADGTPGNFIINDGFVVLKTAQGETEICRQVMALNDSGDLFITGSGNQNQTTARVLKKIASHPTDPGQWVGDAWRINPLDTVAGATDKAITVSLMPISGDIIVTTIRTAAPAVHRISASTGAVVWSKQVAFEHAAAGIMATVDPSDNIYVVGSSNSSLAVVKLSSSGGVLWNKNITIDTPSPSLPHSGGVSANASGVFFGVDVNGDSAYSRAGIVFVSQDGASASCVTFAPPDSGYTGGGDSLAVDASSVYTSSYNVVGAFARRALFRNKLIDFTSSPYQGSAYNRYMLSVGVSSGIASLGDLSLTFPAYDNDVAGGSYIGYLDFVAVPAASLTSSVVYLTPTSATVVDLEGGSTGSSSLSGDITVDRQLEGGSIGSSSFSGDITKEVSLAGGGAGGSTLFGGLSVGDDDMSYHGGIRDSIITTQNDVGLMPLVKSHEADQIETDLKWLFIDLFHAHLRASEREVNTLGMPHIGGSDQFERSVKSEGLALLRGADQRVMRYLFKAWKARNPKRGLHMLRLYLQLIWPNGWELAQLWHDPAMPYPTGISDISQAGFYLTSRLRVAITDTGSSVDVGAVARTLRSVIPARFVVDVQFLSRSQMDLSMAVGAGHALFHNITGTFH